MPSKYPNSRQSLKANRVGTTGLPAAKDQPPAHHLPLQRFPANVVRLQRQIGNQAVIQLLRQAASPTPPMMLNHLTPALQRQGDGKNPPPVDTAAADRDLETFKARVATIKQLNTPGFVGLMEQYVAAIKTSNRSAVDRLIEKIVSFMDRQRAFQIQGTTYQDINETSTDVPREMAVKAQQQAEGLTLWSKLTALPPLRRIQEVGKGVSLESSVAGGLFDGLSFGVPWGNDLLSKQWTLISQNFVKYAQGVVHSMVLQGVHPRSVFVTTEWPIIQELMAAGRVTALIVHVFDVPGGNYDAELQPVKRYWVTSPSDFDRIPTVDPDDKAFIEKQNHVYKNYASLKEQDTRFQTLDTDA